ncbi:OST-HTH/LOTUS domain-containing protein [Sinorhizobium meliloti]|uniref:OST-HTH/LOTUS domain-containing protein n=1 Tax=Rhizobium meliloti TaxID=382 RepID=UPI001E34B370|nr:OST-HTH/LOTUS domain-containing protein [Sinorhizobium meliloti]UFX12871.1 OST-HTH/LOTUS domain-containing protein [Sinorhizobium meliloti]
MLPIDTMTVRLAHPLRRLDHAGFDLDHFARRVPRKRDLTVSVNARRRAPSLPLATSSFISTCSMAPCRKPKRRPRRTNSSQAGSSGKGRQPRPVGAHLAKEAPDFDAGNYGFARLSDLVAASGLVEMESTGDHPASSKFGNPDQETENNRSISVAG